jgi:hypothetical protein
MSVANVKEQKTPTVERIFNSNYYNAVQDKHCNPKDTGVSFCVTRSVPKWEQEKKSFEDFNLFEHTCVLFNAYDDFNSCTHNYVFLIINLI